MRTVSPHHPHATRARVATRRPAEEDPEFQIAPMIDILLVLLVFFMAISSTEVLQVNKEVALPVAKGARPADPQTQGQTIVNVLWNAISDTGRLEIDHQVFAEPSHALDLLRARAQVNPAMRIVIRADRGVRYEYLKQVMVTAAQAGVGKVTFSVIDGDPATSPANPTQP